MRLVYRGSAGERAADGQDVVPGHEDAVLPPAEPTLLINGPLAEGHAAAVAAIGRLGVAGAMVPEHGVKRLRPT